MTQTDWPTVELYVEESNRHGSTNMAIDEYLLEQALEQQLCAVRVYGWHQATVSLGYFQKPDELSTEPRFSELTAVRRLSGGGAILHHHELTYSCVVPAAHPVATNPSDLYELAHRAIVSLLKNSGVEAQLRGEDRKLNDEPFLCFVRGDRNDILLAGQKIVGSAQRRRRGAVLQHGSIILAASEFAPEIAGIADLHRGWQPPSSFRTQLGEAIAAPLGKHLKVETIVDDGRISELVEQRYALLDGTR